jgi:hypothetical protein
MIEMLNQKIAPLAIELLLEEPFYGHLLSGLIKRPERVGDVALAVREFQLALYVDEDWLDAAGPPGRRRGRLKHELLHLVFRHPLRREEHHRSVFYHMAADLVVNQFLDREELEPEAVILDHFEGLGLKAGGRWEDYYQALVEAWGAVRRGAVRENAGWVELVERCLSGRHPALQRHRYWSGEGIFLSAAMRAVIDAQATELLRRVRQRVGPEGIGRLPQSVQIVLKQYESASRLDWRRIIRLFAASSRKTRMKNTIRRPSKRYGTTPGLQVVRTGRLIVAVDTSASVAQEVLNAFFAEIHQRWRRGNELMIVECDTVIRRRYEYRGHLPGNIRGRGGTLYDAPIQWANQYYRPDGILYFTDGQGPAPLVRSHASILWVIVGRNGAHLPGRRVRLGLDT